MGRSCNASANILKRQSYTISIVTSPVKRNKTFCLDFKTVLFFENGFYLHYCCSITKIKLGKASSDKTEKSIILLYHEYTFPYTVVYAVL